jgi:radical SAM superfamily enzyme YgiQ (UPF0313 family)
MPAQSALDAIIIADSGVDSLSGTNPLKLNLDGRVGDIQVVTNYIRNNGRIIPPIEGDNHHSWSSAPKLNGIHLSSYLTQKKFNVELIHNYAGEKKHFSSLLSQNPKAVIISTSFIFFKKTLYNLVNDIRSLAPDICIIVGGSFVYYSYLLLGRTKEKEYETRLPADDFLFLKIDNEPEIDLYIISPKGENILCQALDRIQNGHPLDGINNTAILEGNSYSFGTRTNDFSGVPSEKINWEILPASLFSSGVIPIQASNGCPYDCAFCNFTKDPRFNFVKSIDQLTEELKTVQQRGADYVWFVDDNFRLGRSDLDTVCRRFIDEGIQVKWMCFIRASTLQNTNLALLRRAGCIEVQIGLESGDSTILSNMNKKSNPVMYQEVIRNVLNHGINVSCYFIMGFPGETEATATTTRNFIRTIENSDTEGYLSWSIYPFMLSPLSPVYEPETRKKYGLTGYLKNWQHKTMDYNGAKKLVVKAFLEIEKSGPIYRGDNLDFLEKLSPEKRKMFFMQRHSLAKQALLKELTSENIIQSLQGLVPK